MSNYLIKFECEVCGANETSRAVDCCDWCIIKMFANNPKAGSLEQELPEDKYPYDVVKQLKLVEQMADELVELHNQTGIDLEYWQTARLIVEMFYDVNTKVTIGKKRI